MVRIFLKSNIDQFKLCIHRVKNMQITLEYIISDSNYHFLINIFTWLFYLQNNFLKKRLQIEKSYNILLTILKHSLYLFIYFTY